MSSTNCANCGAAFNPAGTCDYCGTGVVRMLKRAKRGLAELLHPPSLTPEALRETSAHNANELEATCDVTKEVAQVNKYIEQAALGGYREAHFAFVYVFLSERKRRHLIMYYEAQGFKVEYHWRVTPDQCAESPFWIEDAGCRETNFIKVVW